MSPALYYVLLVSGYIVIMFLVDPIHKKIKWLYESTIMISLSSLWTVVLLVLKYWRILFIK